MAMTLVSTTTVGSGGAASIEFTNIPQTGKDILVLASLRSTGVTNFLRINGDSGANYTNRRLRGDGTNTTSAAQTSDIFMEFVGNATGTDNTFGNSFIYISNYTSSANKSISIDTVNENNATLAYQELRAGVWAQTAAVTSFSIGGGNEFSTVNLYIIS